MTQADILRIFEEQQNQAEREAAEAKRLSKARANLKRRMDEVEFRNEDTYDFSN